MGTQDLSEIRSRVRGTGGKQYWRSLEELAETPEFQEYLHREFPENATEWIDPVGRRSFLKLMSASLALAGVNAACTAQPTELIVPYVRQPEEEIPGRPLFFSTAMTLGGVATGLIVESHEGRPTKVEGNPDHPGSLGATDLYAQASVLTLYDPDRSQSILQLGEIRPWSAFITAMRAGLSAQAATKGAGLRILTETVASPTLAAQLQQVLAANPAAKWIQWEPVPAADNSRAGLRAALGQYVAAALRLHQGRRRRVARRRLPVVRGRREPALRAAVLVTPPSRCRSRSPEPLVCGRADAVGDRHERGSQAADEGERD